MPRPFDQPLIRAIGARIAAARLAVGMTQAELAEKLGVEPETLSRYETGARSPTVTTLARVADLLGVRLASLVDADEPLPTPTRSPEVERLIRLVDSLDDDRRDLAVRLVEQVAL